MMFARLNAFNTPGQTSRCTFSYSCRFSGFRPITWQILMPSFVRGGCSIVGCESGSWLTMLGFEVELKDRMTWNDREAKREVRGMDDMMQNNWKPDHPYKRGASTVRVDDCIVGGRKVRSCLPARGTAFDASSTSLIRSSQLQPQRYNPPWYLMDQPHTSD